jgi:hypothetical protein
MLAASPDHLPLLVSLTTTPSRLPHIRPTLDSLFEQTLTPDRVLLCLPTWSKRENTRYCWPVWLSAYVPRLQIVECQEDFGPGTKLLGALDHMQDPSCLIIADDDMRYKRSFLEILYQHQIRNTRASFSYYTYKVGPITLGQGADGFSFHSSNLRGIRPYAERAIAFPPLRVVDDLWISAYLWHRGVQVESLAHTVPDRGAVYEISHSLCQLRDLSGELDRRNANKDGLNYLFEKGLLGRGHQVVSLAKKVARDMKGVLRR